MYEVKQIFVETKFWKYNMYVSLKWSQFWGVFIKCVSSCALQKERDNVVFKQWPRLSRYCTLNWTEQLLYDPLSLSPQDEMRFWNISHTVIVYGVGAAIKDLLSSHYWVGGRRYRICKLHFESNKTTSHGVFVHQSNRFIRTPPHHPHPVAQLNPLLPTNCVCSAVELIIKRGSLIMSSLALFT